VSGGDGSGVVLLDSVIGGPINGIHPVGAGDAIARANASDPSPGRALVSERSVCARRALSARSSGRSSNGLAAGDTTAPAQLAAIYEINQRRPACRLPGTRVAPGARSNLPCSAINQSRTKEQIMPTETSITLATGTGPVDPSANEERDHASPIERLQRVASVAVSRSESDHGLALRTGIRVGRIAPV
jgi:hypothetical protein